MHNEPREKLRELIVEYGRSLCDDPRRCEALLKDYCGQYKREIFVLITALKNRVADDLLKTSVDIPQILLLARLVKRLEDELGLAETAAKWAVESWALALGVPPVLTALSIFHDRLRDGSTGPAMIAIPAGEFWMGSPESETGRHSHEHRHRVKIEQPFAIGQYAVTFEEYDRFCTDRDRAKPDDCNWDRGNRPVINVSWIDALDYTEWLSAQTGQNYRLPTEAEWEYAARAGTESAFWWGNDISPDQSNYDGNYTYRNGPKGVYCQQTVPVDRFQPNPWGLYQVHGNVWEWTCSVYDKDYGGTEKKFANNSTVNPVSVRGGAWDYFPVWVRAAARTRNDPANLDDNLGFRLARFL